MSEVIKFPTQENITEILECECESLTWVFIIGEGIMCPHCQISFTLEEMVEME